MYHYINLTSTIIFCFFSGDIYLYLFISVSLSTVCGNVFETFVFSLAILLPLKLPIPSAAFGIAFFFLKQF